ncbi:2'-5' RNA ligase family protein [Kineosporia sp. NBRC 101731]|uniref:2'-5' RNA ligase family protein n=1 Tax=Kineosporia sp. NBRC 101731 TaxID=3032199 RepID=UPI0024A1AE1C|nr:2'-5' RNA ligase family protein [Kineosporia sp. NBRC 101731]GLY27819.1 phosphoesterase [Kineosporia sp. NBRC 101731]
MTGGTRREPPATMSMALVRPVSEDVVTIGVVLDIPQPQADFLRQSRAGFGDPLAAEIPPHITLLPPTQVPAGDDQAIQDHLRAVAAVTTRFSITLGGTGSFRPISPVVFVKLEDGAEHCADLQRLIRTGPLKRALPFDYHPHVTVAHHLDDPAMDRAESELADYRSTFDVCGLNFYEHGRDGLWQLRRRFGFKGDLLDT